MDVSNSVIENAIKNLIDAGVDINDARIEVSDFLDSSTSKEDFDNKIARRLGGEPAAYIIGSKPFYKSEFVVMPGVLIPRSDTELLVEAGLKFLRCLSFPMGDVVDVPETRISHNFDGIHMLDLCTGSGCIGISIHKELLADNRNVRTTLVDISDNAITCAKRNSEGINNIDVINCDVLDDKLLLESFECASQDIVVSNPPYIDSKDMEELEIQVKFFEPHLALYGGEDGLMFYEIICKHAMKLLKNGGALMVEHGYNQGESVSSIFVKEGFTNVMTLKDYGGNDRVTLGIKSEVDGNAF